MVVNYPIKDLIIYKGMNCYDGCVVNYINDNSDGLPYNLLYSDIWNEVDFLFDEENNCFFSSVFTNNLYSFWGIKIILCPDFHQKSIKEIINKKNCLLVKTDLFKYSFSPSYGIHHAPHYFLVHGYDLDEKILYISDPSYDIINQKLDIYEFINIQEENYIFNFDSDFIRNEVLINNETEKIKKSCEELSLALDKIQHRIERIRGSTKESLKDVILREALYFNRLACNRFCSIKYFEWYYNKKQEDFYYSKYFLYFGKKYETIKNMFYKFAIIDNSLQLFEEILAAYKKIAREEKLLASKIIDGLYY